MTAPDSPSLSIVIPALNEEDGIERAIDAARAAADDLVASGEIVSFEILVVDDCSTDSTVAVVEQMGLTDSRVGLLRLDRHRGLGGAVTEGLRRSSGDLVLYTDADLPFDLAELSTALRLMRRYQADVVSAYRHDRAGEGFRRWLYSHLYNGLIRARLRLRVRDVNFAGKLLTRRVVDTVQLRSEGSFFDAELLAKADRHGFRIVQFGVDYFPRSRGVSTLSSPAVIRTILAELRAITPDVRALGEPTNGHGRRTRP